MTRLRHAHSLSLLLALAGAAHAQCNAPRLLAPTAGAEDQFASAAAIEGGTILIGNPFTSAAGFADRGSVDVFVNILGWNHVETIAPNSNTDMWFGRSVALSGDWAVVGAPMRSFSNGGEGGAYFFKRQNGHWTQKGFIGAGPDSIGNDHAGLAVAIDGDYAIIGMPDASPFQATWMGRARIAVRVGDVWNDIAWFYGPQAGVTGGNAGSAVGVHGNLFMMSAPGAAVAGLPNAGVVCLTLPDSGDYWYADTTLHASDYQEGARFGRSAALGDGIVVAGAPDYDVGNVPDAGAVYIYETDQFGIWIEKARLLPPAATPLAHFGQKVTIDGGRILITEPGTGKVYSYRKSPLGAWIKEWQLHDPFDLGEGFGFALASSGGKVVVGSPLGEVQSLTSAGWAHVFDLDGDSGADASLFAPAATIGTRTGCTTMATNDGDTTCGSSNTRPDVWYRFTPPCSGMFTIDTNGSDFDTVLSIHSSSLLTAGPTIACNDDVGGFLTFSRVQPALTSGQTYFIRISGNNQNGGNYVLNIAGCAPAPCYANCDGSTASPVLNVNDFVCFANRFAAGSSYANCDASTATPVLNVNDFTCFVNRYAVGCP